MAIQPSWLNRLFSVDTYNLSTSVQSSTNCDLFGIEDLDKALASAELIFSRVIDEVEHATFLDVLCMSLKAKALVQMQQPIKQLFLELCKVQVRSDWLFTNLTNL